MSTQDGRADGPKRSASGPKNAAAGREHAQSATAGPGERHLMAQLAIAGCAANPNVSTVILGASRISQLQENLRALEVLDALDEEALAPIDEG